MAWTQSDLDELEKSIKAGTLRVRFADREVIYRTLEEMLKIRDLIKRELGLSSGGPFRKFVSYWKGTDQNG